MEELTQSEAQTAITNAGFVVGTVTTQYSTEAIGEVVSQNPPAGYSAIPGTDVDLVVSAGPSPATGITTVEDIYTFKGDLANDAAFSSNPGNDVNVGDLYGVDRPLTLDTTGFSAVGRDKLVGLLTLGNSAATLSTVTSLTYGGVDVLTNSVANTSSAYREIIFYIDAPSVTGDLVVGLGASGNVDEVGLVLFALNGHCDWSSRISHR